MTRREILDELSTYRRKFPRQAVEAALEMWDEIAAEMVTCLEYTAENMTAVADDEDRILHTYAMFLCAEKREQRALSPMLRILSHPDEDDLDGVLGDSLTEDSGRILASVYAGDVSGIHTLIEDTAANEYARDQGIIALEALLLDGQLDRQEVIEYLHTLYQGRLEREPSAVWNSLVVATANIGATSHWPEVQRAYEDGLADPRSCALGEIERDLFVDPEAAMRWACEDRQRKLVHSAVAEVEWLTAFREAPRPRENWQPSLWDSRVSNEALGGTVRTEGRKTGRNEPCPCGSGRKYKRCCGK